MGDKFSGECDHSSTEADNILCDHSLAVINVNAQSILLPLLWMIFWYTILVSSKEKKKEQGNLSFPMTYPSGISNCTLLRAQRQSTYNPETQKSMKNIQTGLLRKVDIKSVV